MRYHITLVRMAIINKSTDNKCWTECEELAYVVMEAGESTVCPVGWQA